jgi:hypothetical protein
MTTCYVQALRRQGSVEPQQQASPLQARFVAWYRSLPEVSRQRPFSMQEFEAALGTQGKYLSAVLVDLGWTRKRRWSGTRYFRYWLPPAW